MSFGEITSGSGQKWFQTVVSIPKIGRGIHNVTQIFSDLPFLKTIQMGTMHILIQHTSASITLNECPDETVRNDMEMVLNKLVPEGLPYTHTVDGPDDMPAHVKCSMIGSSVTVPIMKGRLGLGVYQGIWLCEHREGASTRTFVVTAQGCETVN